MKLTLAAGEHAAVHAKITPIFIPIKPETKQRAARLLLITLIATVLIDATLPRTVSEQTIPHLDKLMHFLVYGFIAWLCAYVFHKPAQASHWIRMAGIT